MTASGSLPVAVSRTNAERTPETDGGAIEPELFRYPAIDPPIFRRSVRETVDGRPQGET
jgi:hypothetical protein